MAEYYIRNSRDTQRQRNCIICNCTIKNEGTNIDIQSIEHLVPYIVVYSCSEFCVNSFLNDIERFISEKISRINKKKEEEK